MGQELESILKLQSDDGFFPTYGADKTERIQEVCECLVRNIGIHTFVLEKLLQLFPNSTKARQAFQRGLFFLLGQSIKTEQGHLWRWLKEPTRQDYMYPFDYDDTSRARTIINLAQDAGFKIPKEFRDFDYLLVLSQGLTSDGVFTFIGDKPGNVVCPVVNANLLYSYGLHLAKQGKNPYDDPTFNRIRSYLQRSIRNDKFQSQDFSEFSKFYLNHSLLVYLLSQQTGYFDKATLDIAKKRIQKIEGEYSNPLDAAWATSALIVLGGDDVLIDEGIKQIQNSKNNAGLWDAEPFYQHQRLGNVFGSSAATTVFCLEALKLAQTRR